MSAEEYLLKAENYVFAAQFAPPERQRAFIRAAAICRNRALRLTLAARKQAACQPAHPMYQRH